MPEPHMKGPWTCINEQCDGEHHVYVHLDEPACKCPDDIHADEVTLEGDPDA